MPLIENSTYRPPLLFRNRHVQTIFSNRFRSLGRGSLGRGSFGGCARRDRLELPDGDFIDLDWVMTTASDAGSGAASGGAGACRPGATPLVILAHGLEGSAQSVYMQGMRNACLQTGWDVLSINFRGCSGELNRTLRFSHGGASDDVRQVVNHVTACDAYDRIALIGFSLGANKLLKYLGEEGSAIHPSLFAAVAFSVPCDLESSVAQFRKTSSAIYHRMFVRELCAKTARRINMGFNLSEFRPALPLSKVKTFDDFDHYYTAPLHGFRDAKDYWARSSSTNYIGAISIPTLIVNSLDDPLLGDKCYPRAQANDSKYVYLETPNDGGHVGFISFQNGGRYWSEERALSFLRG